MKVHRNGIIFQKSVQVLVYVPSEILLLPLVLLNDCLEEEGCIAAGRNPLIELLWSVKYTKYNLVSSALDY